MARKTSYTKEDIKVITQALLKNGGINVSKLSKEIGYSYGVVYAIQKMVKAMIRKEDIDMQDLSIGEEVQAWVTEIMNEDETQGLKEKKLLEEIENVELGDELQDFLETTKQVEVYSREAILSLLKQYSIEEVAKKIGKSKEEIETIMRVNALINIAKRYKKQNNTFALKGVLKEILNFEPENVYALNTSAKIDLKEGNTEEAEQKVRKAIEIKDSSMQSHSKSILLRILAEKMTRESSIVEKEELYKLAREVLYNKTSIDIDQIDGYVAMITYTKRVGETLEYQKFVMEAYERHPEVHFFNDEKINMKMTLNSSKEGIDVTKKALEDSLLNLELPNPETIMNMAREFLKKGDTEKYEQLILLARKANALIDMQNQILEQGRSISEQIQQVIMGFKIEPSTETVKKQEESNLIKIEGRTETKSSKEEIMERERKVRENLKIAYEEAQKERSDGTVICEAIKKAYQISESRVSLREIMNLLITKNKMNIIRKINKVIIELNPNDYRAARNLSIQRMRNLRVSGLTEEEILYSSNYLTAVPKTQMGRFYKLLGRRKTVEEALREVSGDKTADIIMENSFYSYEEIERELSTVFCVDTPARYNKMRDSLYSGKIQEGKLDEVLKNLKGVEKQIAYVEICAYLGRTDLLGKVAMSARELPAGKEKRLLNAALEITKSGTPKAKIARRANFDRLYRTIGYTEKKKNYEEEERE